MTTVSNIKGIFCVLFAQFCFSFSASAQLYLKLQWMPDDDVWGVFVKSDSTIQPTQNVLLGSGQITIVAPTGFEMRNMTSYMGSWDQNARANSPSENPDKDYISFGIKISERITDLGAYDEALILTFSTTSGECPPSLYLIENDDPFVATVPNSYNTNPGNDLQVVDLGNDRKIYQYKGNYALDNWNCDPAAIMTTSLETQLLEKRVSVYPNPIQESVVFEVIAPNQTTNLAIKLNDNFGRIIYHKAMKSNPTKIQMDATSGLYFYQIYDVHTNQLLQTGKLLKR